MAKRYASLFYGKDADADQSTTTEPKKAPYQLLLVDDEPNILACAGCSSVRITNCCLPAVAMKP